MYENIQATLKACGPHAVAYTLKIRSGCEGGGKGALVQTNMSATLATNNDQYLFMPVCSSGDVAGTLDANYYKGSGMRQGVEREYVVQPVSIENHPADSRVNIDASGKVQTLTSRMGTGGGNVPLVMDPVAYNGENITSPLNKTNPQPGDPCHTLGTDSRNYLVYCLRGNGINCPSEACDVDCELHPTPNGGQSRARYIVRRLTPTECARLQGFPDNWGHIDEKSDFTDEEYAFWLDVRNTHAAINDKVVKDYTKDQMLTWYNKLHTDSSEYKLWGNGIALPCALYIMQGIAGDLCEPRN